MLVIGIFGFVACESDSAEPNPSVFTYEEVIPGDDAIAAISGPEEAEITNSTSKSRDYTKQEEEESEPLLYGLRSSLDSLDWEVNISTVDTVRTYTVTGVDTTYTDSIVYGEPYPSVVKSPYVIKLADDANDNFTWGPHQGIGIHKAVLDTLRNFWIRIDNVKFGVSPKVESDLEFYIEGKGYDSEGNLVFTKLPVTPGQWVPLKPENNIMSERFYFYGPNNLPNEAVTVADLSILMRTQMFGLHTFQFTFALPDGTMVTQEEAKVKSLPTQRFIHWYQYNDESDIR